MVNRCRKVVSELVSYIEKYHPEVLFMVRSTGGKGLGLPNIVILERRNVYRGLSLWATSEITDSKMDQMDRFVISGHAVSISGDYDGLRSCLTEYLSMDRPDDSDYVTDSIQLDLIKSLNSKGVIGDFKRRDRTPLTSSDIDTLNSVVRFLMKKYKYAAIMPTFGSESGPDITIFSNKSVHNGLAIWLSKSYRCYNLSSLSHSQFHHLLNMANRSYLTIASLDYQDITDMIHNYMISEYEHYGSLPKFCEEDCW